MILKHFVAALTLTNQQIAIDFLIAYRSTTKTIFFTAIIFAVNLELGEDGMILHSYQELNAHTYTSHNCIWLFNFLRDIKQIVA